MNITPQPLPLFVRTPLKVWLSVDLGPFDFLADVTLQDNLCYDVSAATWGGNGLFYSAQGGDTISAVGFTNYAGGDYSLTPTSPYIAGATDGSRVGFRP